MQNLCYSPCIKQIIYLIISEEIFFMTFRVNIKRNLLINKKNNKTMNKKFLAAVVAVVAALVIYKGGWYLIQFVGDNVFSFPWHFGEILVLSLASLILIFCTVVVPYGIYKKIAH